MGKMLVRRKHPWTKDSEGNDVFNTLELDITPEQYKAWLSGTVVQKAMPNLNADEREFVMTGILPGEWDEMFKEVVESDDY